MQLGSGCLRRCWWIGGGSGRSGGGLGVVRGYQGIRGGQLLRG